MAFTPLPGSSYLVQPYLILSSYSLFFCSHGKRETHDSNSHIIYLARLLLRISIETPSPRQNKSKSVIRAYVNISITMTVPEHLGSPFRTQTLLLKLPKLKVTTFPPPLQTFTLFPMLPIELRTAIWHEVCCEPRSIEHIAFPFYGGQDLYRQYPLRTLSTLCLPQCSASAITPGPKLRSTGLSVSSYRLTSGLCVSLTPPRDCQRRSPST